MEWQPNDDRAARRATRVGDGGAHRARRLQAARPLMRRFGLTIPAVLAALVMFGAAPTMAQEAKPPDLAVGELDARAINETIDRAHARTPSRPPARAQLDAQVAQLQSLFAEPPGAAMAGQTSPPRLVEDPGAPAERSVAQAKALSTLPAEANDGAAAGDRRSVELARLIAGYEARLAALRERHRATIAELRAENARLAADKSAVFAELARQTRDFYASATRIIQQTGLDAEALLAEAGFANVGQGGPFLATDSLAAFDTDASGSRLSLGEVAALRRVMRSLPLAAPLKEYRITSRFGPRRDPFNGQKAMHEGVDLSAPFATEVFAPAPGRVTVAGIWGSYGLAIEIDHGAGLTTRFGHLSRIVVEEGQVVAFGERIGHVGSSGRSTGPHLHYEVRFTNRPKDPLDFIRAGDDVFQTADLADEGDG